LTGLEYWILAGSIVLALTLGGCNPAPVECAAPTILRADGVAFTLPKAVYKVTRKGDRLIVTGDGIEWTYEGATIADCVRVPK
jgi:hypothetical protein